MDVEAPQQFVPVTRGTQYRALVKRQVAIQKKHAASLACSVVTCLAIIGILVFLQHELDTLVPPSKGGVLMDLTQTSTFYTPNAAMLVNSFDHYAYSDTQDKAAGTLPRKLTEPSTGLLSFIKRKPYVFPGHNDTHDVGNLYYDPVSGAGEDAVNAAISDAVKAASAFDLRAFPMLEGPYTGSCDTISKWANWAQCLDEEIQLDKPVMPIRYSVPNAGVSFDVVKPEELKMTVQYPDTQGFVPPPYWPDSMWYVRQQPSAWPNIRLGVVLGDIMHGVLTWLNTNSTIAHASSPLPYVTLPQKRIDIGFITGFVLSITFSFYVPAWALQLVMEKESRSYEIMRMNGMDAVPYYVVNYANFVLQFLVVSTIGIITCVLLGFTFFTKSIWISWLLPLVTWGFAQASLSFFIAHFFKNAKPSAPVIKAIVWISVIAAIVAESTLVEDGSLPFYLYVYPVFPFFHAFFMVEHEVSNPLSHPYSWDTYTSNVGQIVTCEIALIVLTVVYLGAAMYLDLLHTGEFGVSSFTLFGKKKSSWKKKKDLEQALVIPAPERSPLLVSEVAGSTTTPAPPLSPTIEQAKETKYAEDDDVLNERLRVYSGEYSENALIVAKDLNKTFTKTGGVSFTAVQSLCLEIEKGTCFTLLGPNGAGKTTTINILSGMITPTAGTAIVNGYDITTDMYEIRKQIGMCPQHDVLWPELTVFQHLLYYCRMKGVSRDQEKATSAYIGERIGLANSLHLLPKELSGGMKRRLSVGLAMLGNTKVIFLDEPTTGLDPSSRRMIWDIISEQKQGKAILLTTHSMEEADTLSNKIGIMSQGYLRCVGTPIHLKNKFGVGYRLVVNGDEDHAETVKKFVVGQWPNTTVSTQFKGNIQFLMPHDTKLGQLFDCLNKKMPELWIKDWGVSQTTLEDVFMRIVREAEDDTI